MATLPRSTKNFNLFLCVMLFLVILATQIAVAQQNMQDVVYLKNGNIIRGTIIEQVPNESIRIKTSDGNIFSYKFSEVEKLTKEAIKGSPRSSGKINYPLAKTAILINPMGFIQFGPIIEAEFKIAPNTIFGPHIRFSNLGLLYHLIVDYDELTSGMAIGVTAKRFYGGDYSPNRFFLGSFVEYGWGGGRDDWGEYKHSYISLISNFGYRWYLSSFFVNVGLIAGMAYEVSDERTQPSRLTYSKDIFFLGMVEVSIGFDFK